MLKENVQVVKQSLAKFVGSNVFCYEDEDGVMQNENTVDHEAVADTRDVLLLYAQIYPFDKKHNIDLASQLLAGAVNVLKAHRSSQPVESHDHLQALILSK